MRQYMQNALDGLFPFNPFEEMGKQNMAFFESAMKMFSPFYPQGGAPGAEGRGDMPQAQGGQPRIEDLQARLNALQHQIDALSKK
jgi:polyhydroxyalkanoate synthesis regulator protein